MKFFCDGAEGKLAPFILVVEGSIPNEKNKPEGYWASFGTDETTGQPITTCDWIDRLNSADASVITKMDLASAVEFDEATASKNIQAVRPGMHRKVSAKTGEGMNAFLEFLETQRSHSRAAAAV